MRYLQAFRPLAATSLLMIATGFFQGCATGSTVGPKTLADLPDAFACNEWFDRDQNGMVAAQEFEGIKSTFSYFEELSFVARYDSGVGALITWRLFGPERTVLRQGSATGRWDRGYRMVRFEVGSLIDQGGLGDYRMEWYLEDTPTKTTRVRLTR